MLHRPLHRHLRYERRLQLDPRYAVRMLHRFGDRDLPDKPLRFERRLQLVNLLIPFSQGARLAELHALAGDLVREDTPHGVRVTARLPAGVAERFTPFMYEPDPVPAPLAGAPTR